MYFPFISQTANELGKETISYTFLDTQDIIADTEWVFLGLLVLFFSSLSMYTMCLLQEELCNSPKLPVTKPFYS